MNKIIFFDLDGTLLTSQKEVLEENKEAIKKARENDIEVCICSGRQLSAVKKYQKMAGASKYVISTNGAEIYDMDAEEELFAIRIEPEISNAIYNYCIENNLFLRVDTKYARHISNMKYKVIDEIPLDEDFERFSREFNILQISIGSKNSEDIDKFLEFFKQFSDLKIENRFITDLTADPLDMVNIIVKSASKGNAILGLCRYLKISPEDAIAFGDDYNDISMFKTVGHPVAMGNAFDELKALASEVTTTNNEPGIAQILNRLIEENKCL